MAFDVEAEWLQARGDEVVAASVVGRQRAAFEQFDCKRQGLIGEDKILKRFIGHAASCSK